MVAGLCSESSESFYLSSTQKESNIFYKQKRNGAVAGEYGPAERLSKLGVLVSRSPAQRVFTYPENTIASLHGTVLDLRSSLNWHT